MVKSKITDLHQLLSQSLGKGVEILEQTTSILTAPGEHYGSIMLALNVAVRKESGKEEDLHLVAKLIPANAMLRLAFDTPITFKKEVFAYKVTIPALVAFQREYNVSDEKLLDRQFPKCYGARISRDEGNIVVDEDAVILFENLKFKGYKTEDRLIGFDLDAAKIIIRDLARFHAVPIAMRMLKPELFRKKVMPALVKNKGLEQLPPEVGSAFHNSIMEGAREIPELSEYLHKIQKIVNLAAENPDLDCTPPGEIWGTMTHSDYWVSNTMLLRDKNGKTIRNKMVDLQIMTYSSPVRDLLFLMFTSIINSVLDQHCDKLIKLYHDSFINTLKEFNLDVSNYSWEEFNKELNKVAPTEVYHILVMLKPVCTEREKVQNNLEEFQDSDWSRKDLLGPSHRRKLRDTVLALAARNWI